MEDRRNLITLKEHGVENVHTSDHCKSYVGYDDSWDQNKFIENFRIEIKKMDDFTMEFDVVGIDVSIANAFRRIMLSEIPTMAIEKVYLINNTSIIQDDVLAHRLGLIPIKADPRLFQYQQENSEGTPEDTLKFELKVKCKKNPYAPKSAADINELYNTKILSKEIKWIPFGNQSDIFSENDIGLVHDDILVTKMRPGQEIELEMDVVKGVGKDHAKFSPVATASYRMLPEIKLLKKITGEDAIKLQSCFSPGVISLFTNKKGEVEARVTSARNDSGSREVLRWPEFDDKVRLNKVRDHFIFSVESTGALKAHEIVTESIKVLMDRCKYFLNEIDDLQNNSAKIF